MTRYLTNDIQSPTQALAIHLATRGTIANAARRWDRTSKVPSRAKAKSHKAGPRRERAKQFQWALGWARGQAVATPNDKMRAWIRRQPTKF